MSQQAYRSRHSLAKRILDISVALTLLAMTSPLLVVTAVLIRIFLGSPVLFIQRRPGRHGLPISVMKFRSMTVARDGNGELLPDEVRLTQFGSWLRRSSIDELPQLINVLRGDMSLIGPRPLLMEYLPLYSPEQSRRHEVRPGITGWAQVNGRNAISWEERLRLDVWYVDHYSFWLDAKILFMTFSRVFSARGVNQPGSATMTKFTGSTSDDI
ncbi:MAG: sugar transferase [Rhodocyclaceae bacterium]|jgi:sugar transferase EpsL|nr:sugar transferase [Rhodocyclaceae bacterium]